MCSGSSAAVEVWIAGSPNVLKEKAGHDSGGRPVSSGRTWRRGPHREGGRHRPPGRFRSLIKPALGISLLPRPKWWDFGVQAASAPTGTLGLVPSSPTGSVPGGSVPPAGTGRSEYRFRQSCGLVRERGPMPAPKHPVRQLLAGIGFLSATTTAPGGVLCRDHHAHRISGPTGDPSRALAVGSGRTPEMFSSRMPRRPATRHPLFVTATLHSNPKRLRNHC